MLIESSCVSVGDYPHSRTQPFRVDITGQPVWALRELPLVPVFNPIVLPVLSPIVAVVHSDVLEAIGLEVCGDPVRIADNVLFRHSTVVVVPTIPNYRRRTEVRVVKGNVVR